MRLLQGSQTVRGETLSCFLLLISTAAACVLSISIWITILSNREKGMGWGVTTGIIVGQIALDVFQACKPLPLLFKTIMYSSLVFLFMRALTSFLLPLFPESRIMPFISIILTLIVSWEISSAAARWACAS